VGAIDAVNTATLFAAMLLISVFPVFIVPPGVTNRSFADHFAERLGLDRRASTDIQQLFGASTTASKSLDVLGWLIWSAVLSGLQAVYKPSTSVCSDLTTKAARGPTPVRLGSHVRGYAALLTSLGRGMRGASVAPVVMAGAA
jgi:hypothetical protein